MVTDIVNTNSCTGCTACYSICPKKAIRIVKDKEGFDIPVTDRGMCVECGMWNM